MKVTIRLVASIWFATLLIIGIFAFFQIREEHARLRDDLERRAALLAETLKESVEPAARRRAAPAIVRVLKKFGLPDRHLAVYDAFGGAIAAAPPGVRLPAPLPEITGVV